MRSPMVLPRFNRSDSDKYVELHPTLVLACKGGNGSVARGVVRQLADIASLAECSMLLRDALSYSDAMPVLRAMEPRIPTDYAATEMSSC